MDKEALNYFFKACWTDDVFCFSGSSNHDADSKTIIAVIVSIIIVAIIIAAGYILWKKPNM